jgi:hypothetical protein
MLMSDLGVIMYDDWRRSRDDQDAQRTARMKARSAILRSRGIGHAIETITYHQSFSARRTRRNIDRAIERLAARFRVDFVLRAPTTDQLPPGTGVGDRHLQAEMRTACADESSTPGIRTHGVVDDPRHMVDALWIDLGGSG